MYNNNQMSMKKIHKTLQTKKMQTNNKNKPKNQPKPLPQRNQTL